MRGLKTKEKVIRMATLQSKNPYYLAEMTWPQIKTYLETRDSVILPVGSTEQHGPNGLMGIDFLSSFELAMAVSEKTQTLVCPPLPYGMAVHHMAFPGTMTFSPSTYIKVIVELLQSLQKHGFKKIWVINGHGGNIAPITTAFCEFLNSDQSVDLQLINWWHLDEVTSFEKEVFQDKNGFHATCGEVALTMYTHEEAYKRNPQVELKEPGPQKTRWPLSPVEFRKHFPDGRMGSLPTLATVEYGKIIFNKAADAIVRKIQK
jgi:creatinine amidohydrolase